MAIQETAIGPIEKCSLCKGGAAEQSIFWNCLPVPCFGDPLRPKVKVASIGINPSSFEFFDLNDNAKPQADRLPILEDFHVQERAGLSQQHLDDARNVRNRYFSNKPHSWFTPMQIMLRSLDMSWSLAEGTAIQVDVIACATTARFSEVPKNAQAELARNCSKHLTNMLRGLATGTWLIINGRAAFNALNTAIELIPDEKRSGKIPHTLSTSAFVGRAKTGEDTVLPYFGWSSYLQQTRMGEVGAIVDYWMDLRLR